MSSSSNEAFTNTTSSGRNFKENFLISELDGEASSNSVDDDQLQLAEYNKYSIDAFPSLPKASATQFSSILTILNTLIGGGLLSLPYGFKSTGLLLGVIFLGVNAAVSYISAILLVRIASNPTRNQAYDTLPSYRELAIKCWGWWGAIAVDVTFITLLLGALTTYLIIISTLLYEFIVQYIWTSANIFLYVFITFFVAIVLLLPLSLISRLYYLRFASLLALICDGYLVLNIIYIFIYKIINAKESLLDYFQDQILIFPDLSDWNVFLGFPIFTFAYVFHMSVLPIYDEMKHRSEFKMTKVITISIIVSTFVYYTVGILGYLSYGKNTCGNILDDLTPCDGHGDGCDTNSMWQNLFLALAKVVFAVGLICSFPVLNFILIISLDNILFRSIYGFADRRIWFEPVNISNQTSSSDENNNQSYSSYESTPITNSRISWFDSLKSITKEGDGRGICCLRLSKILPAGSFRRRLFLSAVGVLLMSIIAALVPHIQLLFGIIGTTSGAMTVFIFPAFFSINLDSTSKVRKFAVGLFIFGIITMILCTVAWVLKISNFVVHCLSGNCNIDCESF